MNLESEETASTGGRTAGRCAARAGGSCGENSGFVPMRADLAPPALGHDSTGGS
jgi:hypothetical protein